MFNKLLLLLSMTTIVSNPIIVASSNKTVNGWNERKKNRLSSPTIIDFKQTMSDAFLAAYKFLHPIDYKDFVSVKFLQFFNQKESNISANLVGPPTLVTYDKKFNFIAHDVLKNHLNKETLLSTESYTAKLENQISTHTDLGLSLNLPIQILETFGINTVFSFDSSKNTKVITENEYSIPEQHIPVPAHKQVEVNAYWSQSKMIQKVALNVDISGNLRGVVILKHYLQELDISFADAIFYLQLEQKCPEGISINSDNSVHFEGKAESWNSAVGNEYTFDISVPEDIRD